MMFGLELVKDKVSKTHASAEAIAVTTPNSVAAKVAPQKDYVMIILDANGKVFLEMDDESKK
ncbi:MAG: hypothetical protein ACK4IX_07520, partial [Candidatus Sericytochromatia bacterium]